MPGDLHCQPTKERHVEVPPRLARDHVLPGKEPSERLQRGLLWQKEQNLLIRTYEEERAMLVAPSASCPRSALPDQEGLTILIIEREPCIREMLCWYFHLKGHRPLALLPKQPFHVLWKAGTTDDLPHVILLDISHVHNVMDCMMWLSRQWKSVFPGTLPPMILMTTAIHQQQMVEAMGYLVLTKPFHLHEVSRTIAQALSHIRYASSFDQRTLSNSDEKK